VVDGHLAADVPSRGDTVIRVSHVALPAGLNALARREPDGGLSVYVSDALDPDRQRAAVRAAVRAARRTGWRAALPVPSAALLALSLSGLRKGAGALRAHPVAWGTASAALAAASAAVYVAAVPHGHVPASAARPPAAAVSRPPVTVQPTGHPSGSHRARPPAASTPVAAAPVAAGSPVTVTAQPTPAPGTPSPSAPASSPPPTPAPSPSSSAGGGGQCVTLLGVQVCLHLGSR
jgi:hypothetical protein